METPTASVPAHVITDPQLQLTPDELALLLETTADEPAHEPVHHSSPQSLSTSSDNTNDNSTDATTRVHDPKRMRRSEIEKLSRRRRQSTLREMRDEVKQLEREMSAMLEAARNALSTSSSDHPSQLQLQQSRASAATQLEALRQQFVQLSVDTQCLERAKTDLRHMLRARQLLSQSVQSLAASFANDWEEYSWRHVLEQRAYQPLPRHDLFRIMRESFEAITVYDKRTDVVSSGNAFMGWVDRRHDLDADMFFSFTKRFAGRDPEHVMLASWAIFSDEAMLRRSMALSSAHVRLRVLQEPNDDIMVLHRQTRFTHTNKAFHTVYLLFRLRTDDGYTICFRTIPVPSIQDSLEDKETWVDIFHWIHFKNIRDETTGDCIACEVMFGCAIGGPLFGTIQRFLLGAFATVVRWENAAIAPMFLVAPT